MAGLAPLLVLAAAASCCALVLGPGDASAPSPSLPAAVHDVGEARGWAVPPDNDTNALNKWAMSHRFHVGDVLDFKYADDGDSVLLLVRRGDYDACRAASPARRFADDGDTRFRLDRPGLFYFISAAPTRCEAGQRMVVRAVDARPHLASGPASTPAPGTTQPAAAPRHTLSLAQKQAVAAAAAFVAGFAFTLLIVWLCVCCRA